MSLENLFKHLFLNWCTKKKRLNRGSTKTGWIKHQQDGEERDERDTHIQVKWKLEQEDDNSNQAAKSHSSCRMLLNQQGWKSKGAVHMTS